MREVSTDEILKSFAILDIHPRDPLYEIRRKPRLVVRKKRCKAHAVDSDDDNVGDSLDGRQPRLPEYSTRGADISLEDESVLYAVPPNTRQRRNNALGR